MPRTGLQHRRLAVDGVERLYRLMIPPGSRTRALVLDFHGGGSSPEAQVAVTGIERLAATERIAIASPRGQGDPAIWNVLGTAGLADDIHFVEALIVDVRARACRDDLPVVAMGFSNGAMLASRLACLGDPPVIAVVAVGGAEHRAPCTPSRPAAFLAIHGTADGTIAYAGSDRPPPGPPGLEGPAAEFLAAYRATPVVGTVHQWAVTNGCAPEPSHDERFGGTVIVTTYRACARGADVELWSVTGGGHVWPTGSPFDATAIGWEFASKVLVAGTR